MSPVLSKSVLNCGTSLQGQETSEFVPNSQFIVSRTAHRNNSSDYYINDKKSSFTEVTKLLKSKGIDLDNNRFLILQVCLRKVLHELTSFNATLQCISLPQLDSAATETSRTTDGAESALQCLL